MSHSPDRIHLSGLRGTGFHGVLESERREGQEFTVDVLLELSTVRAAQTDDLADTVDYGAVAVAVVEVVEGPAFSLIESLAARIAEVCLAFPGVLSVEVTVHKPQAPIPVPFLDVTLTIRRTG